MPDLTRLQNSTPVQLVDANDLLVCDISTSTPAGSENGLIVRNIPSGTQTVTEQGSATATLSNVAVTNGASIQLLAANSARKIATFFNSGANSVYIKWGTAASSTSHTIELFTNGFYEMHVPVYTGVIEAISSTGTNTIRVTEI